MNSRILPSATRVDDINPALPIVRNINHNSHSLGSLRQCRIYTIHSSCQSRAWEWDAVAKQGRRGIGCEAGSENFLKVLQEFFSRRHKERLAGFLEGDDTIYNDCYES